MRECARNNSILFKEMKATNLSRARYEAKYEGTKSVLIHVQMGPKPALEHPGLEDVQGMVEGASRAIRPMVAVRIFTGIMRAIFRRDEHDVACVAWPHNGYKVAELSGVTHG